MREIKEIVKEKQDILHRRYLNIGLPLTNEEAAYLAKIAAEQIASACAEVSLPIPRTMLDSEEDGYRTRVRDYDGRVVHGYHVFNGVRRLITQIPTIQGMVYYTDGKRERER